MQDQDSNKHPVASPKSGADESRNLFDSFPLFPENSAGRMMSSEMLRIFLGTTCADAMEQIRRSELQKKPGYAAYIVDFDQVLAGVLPLNRLLFAESDRTVDQIMEPSVVFAHTLDDRETVAKTISYYDLPALPIVDDGMRLVGIVTVDKALDVLEMENTEDIELMAGMSPSHKPYLKTGVMELFRKRIPWLLLLTVGATFTGAIISHYESAIGTYAVLSAFLPMLMDTGGNAGGQASVTVIRGLSLGEIELTDLKLVLWKEIRVAAICGLTLSLAVFLKVFAVDFHFFPFGMTEDGLPQNNLLISSTVSATVFFSVLFAKMTGVLLPMGARKLHVDPAVMASPFITTVVDTVTLMVYFAIGSHLIGF